MPWFPSQATAKYSTMTTFGYIHPADPNLNRLHTAMEYNAAGEPLIRTAIYNDPENPIPVSFTGNIVITGNVNLPGTVNAAITSMPPIVGNVNIANQPTVTLSSNAVTVSGSVTINGTSNVNIVNANPIPITGNVNVSTTGTQQVSFSPTLTDAFGRLRVSEPFTLFDSRNRYYDHQQFSNVTNNGGSLTYDANSSTFGMTVSGTINSNVVTESKLVFLYQPGKSLLHYNSFCGATPMPGLRQRVGLFGASNGIFFEVDGNTYNMVIRSSSSGVVVEDRVPQSSWNGDQLLGSGPSGYTLYPDRDQIFWCDVEWLGVGSVRTGFVINGAYVVCHTFNHANQAGNVTTYMTTATLPIRYEITNTGNTGVPNTFRQICSTVISEGGYQRSSYTQSAGTGINEIRLVTGKTYYPIVSIRLAPSRLDAIVVPSDVDILSASVNYYRWVLLLNATLTGATWTGLSQTGTIQYDTAATAVSGGLELQSGYTSSRELAQLGAEGFTFQIGRTLAGISDTVTLALSAINNNADVLAQLGWQEVT